MQMLSVFPIFLSSNHRQKAIFLHHAQYGLRIAMDTIPLQPDVYTTVAVGFAALLLAFPDFLRQRKIPCRNVHSFHIIVISTARNIEKSAHLADGILLFVTVDHHIFDFRLHILSVSERKSRNNSFSIFRRLFSYLYSAKVFAGLRPLAFGMRS